MAIPSVYINLEDDVPEIIGRLKHNKAAQLILVCPKKCHLFNDPINLKLLKKQVDLLDKELFIFTMDERGQEYAEAAGFRLKSLPKIVRSGALSDIKRPHKKVPEYEAESQGILESGAMAVSEAVEEIKNIAKKFVPEVATKVAEAEDVPVSTKKVKGIIPKVKVTDSIFPLEVVEDYKEEAAKRSVSKTITGVVALSLIIVLLLVFVVLPKATVVVYAKTEPVTRDMDISISSNIKTPDSTQLVMPAVKIDEAANVSGAFQSQGKQEVGNKAGGTVKIYNFTHLPINLKAGTTTLTVGSKTYNLVADVSGLRPTAYSNAKTKEVDPSSLGASVQIIATQGGEDYNLPAGTRVEISNQVFGSKPQLLYAQTDSEITGGTTRYLSVITQDDATAAQAQLTQQALQQIRDKLKTEGLALANGAYNLQVVQFTTDNPVGSQSPSFHATLQIKVSGLAFNQADLDNLVNQRIEQTMDAGKTLKPDQPDPAIVGVKNLDLNNQLATLSIHYQGQAVYNIDLPDISRQLVGKSQTQANEILRSKAEIDRVDITLAPVWQKNFPWFASKINVNVSNTGPNSQ